MTGPGTISTGFDALAMGHAQRRITGTMLPAIGAVIAAGGLAAFVVERFIGSGTATGLPMGIGGLVLAAIAYLATWGLRRPRRLPKPAWVNTNPITTRRYARILSIVLLTVVTVLIGWLLLALRGVTGPGDAVWILPWTLLAAVYATTPLVLFVGRTVEDRDADFRAWLAGRPDAAADLNKAVRGAEAKGPARLP